MPVHTVLLTLVDNSEYLLLPRTDDSAGVAAAVEEIEGAGPPIPRSIGLKLRQSDDPEFWISGSDVREVLAGQTEITPNGPELYQWRLRDSVPS